MIRNSWIVKNQPVAQGYIAGTANGIVSINAKGVARLIYLLDIDTFQVLHMQASLNNGHYLIRALDPNREYIVFARDHHRDYEPVVYDYLKPATDLSHAEQEALWQQMLQAP